MNQDTSQTKQIRHYKPILILLKIGIISYILIYIISHLTLEYLVGIEEMVLPPVTGATAVYFTIAFFLFATPVIYLGNSAIAKKWIELNVPSVLLNMGLAMLLGSVLELTVNTIFVELIGRPSWEYHVWPKYDGFTSGVVAIMWPLYGFHLYLFHRAMKHLKSPLVVNIPVRGIMMAIDAMIMETIANLFAILGFGTYYFFYFRGDLNNFTTIEIFVPYIFVGILVMSILHLLDRPQMPRIAIGIITLIGGWLVVYFG